MNIAIVLTHNKGDVENRAQIEALKLLVTKITDVYPEFESYHYQFNDIDIPHKVLFYQIVPFGVTPPDNFHSLDSHNVLYRKGDEDKTGDHLRFFNWGLKRATDYGADVVFHLEDISSLNIKDLVGHSQNLADNNNAYEFAELQMGKLSTLRLLRHVGPVDEDSDSAIADFKLSIDAAGLEVLNNG